MGCHTWTYVHILSEDDKWAQEYKNAFIKEMRELPTHNGITEEDIKLSKELSELVKNTSIKDIPKLLEERQEDERYYSLMIGGMAFKYGNFEIHNGKIYRDPNELTQKDYYHEMFRIYDYNAQPCYSLEETLKRCEEYKVDWNLHERNGYLVNNKQRIYEFWEKYPDSIIKFG